MGVTDNILYMAVLTVQLTVCVIEAWRDIHVQHHCNELSRRWRCLCHVSETVRL